MSQANSGLGIPPTNLPKSEPLSSQTSPDSRAGAGTSGAQRSTFNVVPQPSAPSGLPGNQPVAGQQVTRDAPGGNLPSGVTSPDAAKSLPDPGVAFRGTQAQAVESPEDRDDRVAAARPEPDRGPARPAPTKEEMEALGFTPLEDHPPLKEGDVIQGPHDRGNRKPTEKELELGRIAASTDLGPDEQELLRSSRQVEIKDPPIDKNAPKDVPADPRKVAESRGIKLKEKPDEEVK